MKEKKTNKKILFGASDPRVAKIADAFAKCGRRGATAAAYAIAAKYVKLYELAEEKRTDKVRVAYGAGALWAKGTIKMPEARIKILAAHSAARAAYSSVARAAARAVAQAVSTVHTAKHAMGVVYYGLTAIALAKGGDVNCDEIEREIERMLAVIGGYADSEPTPDGWAEFMLTKEEKAERKAKLKEAVGKGEVQFSPQDEVFKLLDGGAQLGGKPRKKGKKAGKTSAEDAAPVTERAAASAEPAAMAQKQPPQPQTPAASQNEAATESRLAESDGKTE